MISPLIVYARERARRLPPGVGPAAEAAFLEQCAGMLDGLATIVSGNPGLIDGEGEVNGADLVDQVTQWLDLDTASVAEIRRRRIAAGPLDVRTLPIMPRPSTGKRRR